jgi:outer membrane autotransporter protein
VSATLDAVDARLDDQFLLPVAPRGPAKGRTWANSAWAKGIVTGGDYESTATQTGHTDRTGGLIIGLDASTREHLLAGIYGGLAGNRLRAGNSLSIDSDQHFAGLYAALRFGAFFANAGASIGKADARTYRDEVLERIDGTHANEHLGASLGAGFVLDAWKDARIKPSVSVRHTRIKLKNYEERGDGAMLVPDFDDTLAQGVARVQADQKFTLLGRPAAAGLALGWKQSLRDPRRSVDAAFVHSPGTVVSLETDDFYNKGSAQMLGLSLRVAPTRNSIIALECERETAADSVRHTASLTVGCSW